MKKLLIVVDYQNDFVVGSLGFPGAVALEQPIADKISCYRKNDDDVAFTFDTHDADYLETTEGKKLPIAHCMRDSDGSALYGKVADLLRDTDITFIKQAFGSVELFDFLRESCYDTVELVGVVSNICVISNAVLAKTALPDAQIIVDAKCIASNDNHLNSAAIDVMASLQIDVIL